MDDAQLKRRAWRSIAGFQRLLGEDDDDVLEDDGYVASRMASSRSSIINAVVPAEGLTLPPLEDVERFYGDVPKWGVWIDPATDPSPLTRAKARRIAALITPRI